MIRLARLYPALSKFRMTPVTPSEKASNIWKRVENKDEKIKRLLAQSKARTINTKSILYCWFEEHQDILSETELCDYDDLLSYDFTLYDEFSLLNWILGVEEAPIEYQTEVLNSLKEYAHSARFNNRIAELKYKDLI